MAMPTAVPRMPASASGVSVTRSSPNSLASPSVTRKTPPSVPTSSPMTCTVGSSAMASRRARPRACAMVAGFTATVVIGRRPFRLVARPRGGAPRRPARPATGPPAPGVASWAGRRRARRGPWGRATGSWFMRSRRSAAIASASSRAARIPVLVEQSALGQLVLQEGDRVVRAPGLDLGVAAVALVVVGVRVGLHAVRHRLHERRTAARARVGDGLAEDLVHGGGVVAVDQAAGHSVPDGLVGQGRGRGLLGERDGDREAVVLYEEDDRGLPDGGEVQRLVEVALAGAAVADQGERDHVVALEAGGVREAHGVRELGRERRAQGGDPVLVRVVAGVPVAAQQGQRLDGVEAAGDGGERVAVAGEEPVALLEDQRGGDLAGLLAGGGGVDGEAALLGEGRRLRVVPAASHQLRVQPAQQLRVDPLGRLGAEDAVGQRVGQQRRGIGAGLPGGRRGRPVCASLLHDRHVGTSSWERLREACR